MSLIKIKIYRKTSGCIQKYLVELIPQIHHTVRDFLKMTKQVLQIEWPISEIIILKQGYMLPHSLSARVLVKAENCSFKIINLNQQKGKNHDRNQQINLVKFKAKQQIQQESQSEDQISQEQQIILKDKQKKNKNKNKKISSQNKKNKISFSSSSVSSSSSSESQQSEQQSQSSQLPVINNKKDKLNKKKIQKKQQLQQNSSSQESKSDSHISMKSNNKIFKNINIKPYKTNNASLNQSPYLSAIKRKQLQVEKQQKTQLNKSKITNQDDKKALQAAQDKKIKKKVIEMEQSSQQSSQQQKKKIQQNNASKNMSLKKNPVKLPPSMRQNFQKNTYKAHQEQQWIQVSKQVLKKHYEVNQKLPFVKASNLIRFKIIELDQQKFVPISSQWIQGTVSSAYTEGKVILSKVSQINRPFRQTYQIFQHNMLQLLINKNFITEQQICFINGSKPEGSLKISANQQKIQNQVIVQQKPQEKCSLEKFICGQVNFYFGDKNYPTDLFMRMHANHHSQRYIPIRILLNFPKIKKILRDENKLFEYLISDQKRNQRNYQIDQVNRMIRRKVPENNQPAMKQQNKLQQDSI